MPSLLLRWHLASTQVLPFSFQAPVQDLSFCCPEVLCWRLMLTFFFVCILLREDSVWPWCLLNAGLLERASAAEEAGLRCLPEVRCCRCCNSLLKVEHYWMHFFFFLQSCWIASIHVLKRRAGVCSWQLWASSVVSPGFPISLYFYSFVKKTKKTKKT